MKQNPKALTAALIAAGLSVAVASKVVTKFNATDGTKCKIRSISGSADDIYILFTAVDASTSVKDYCSGSTITVDSDNGTPTLAGNKEYTIDSIISTTDPELSITGFSGVFTTEATSGIFTYHADIASLAAASSIEIVSDTASGLLGALGNGICEALTGITGISCEYLNYILYALCALCVFCMISSVAYKLLN
jgi:hypothetical protein